MDAKSDKAVANIMRAQFDSSYAEQKGMAWARSLRASNQMPGRHS